MRKYQSQSFLLFWIPFFCLFLLNIIYVKEITAAEQVFDLQKERTAVTEKQTELKEKKEINVPLDLEMIGVRVKKQGIYTITLGFDPGDIPIHEFKEHLKRDFTGTIEVLSNTEHYTTIHYEDFVDFAMSPQGGGYGPVYNFEFNFSTSEGILRFYPKIKSKNQYACSFAVTRQLNHSKNIKTTLSSLSNSINKENLQIPVQINRIDVFIEVPSGRYCMYIGFRPNEEERQRGIAYFDRTLQHDYNRGTIEILKNGKKYSYISYSDSIYLAHFESFTGFQYGFSDMHPDWYTFLPKMFSIQKRTFGFEIKPRYLGK